MKTPKVQNRLSNRLQLITLIACVSSASNANEANTNNTTKAQQPTPHIDNVVISTDGFARTDEQNNTIKGNGSGDLVLVVYDSSGKSPRKKSFLLDLSYKDKQGNINDLNLNDISSIRNNITISNPELSTFIQSSKSTDKIIWQVFAIANHYHLGENFGDINLINFGLATTELNKRTKPLTHQELHQSKVHRANLIHENIIYGVNTNESLVSYTGEPSAFNMGIHNNLGDGMPASGKLNQELIFSTHKLQFTIDKESKNNLFTTHYEQLGNFKINQSDTDQSWQLIFSPTKNR